MSIVFVDAHYIGHTKITVVMMIFLFLPNHRYSKLHTLTCSFHPLSQMFNAHFTCTMRHPRFILVPYLDTVVRKIQADHRVRNRFSLIIEYVFTTNVTKHIRVVHTTSKLTTHNEISRYILSVLL